MILQGVANVLSQQGRDVTYKSLSGVSFNYTTRVNTPTYTDYTVKAHIKDAKVTPIDGYTTQNRRECRISPNSLSVTPKENDIIVDGGIEYKVENVNIHSVNNQSILYVLMITGNANTK